VGAKRYCNQKKTYQDFEAQRETYYQALKQPMDATAFITQLQQEMTALTDAGLPDNEQVNILKKTTAGLEFLSSRSQSHSTCCGSKVRSASAGL